MNLLRKNFILASIASVAMVGSLSSSSASALDGFSFSDIINDYRDRTEQLQSSLLNPSRSDSESTISRNEASFPTLLFNGAPNNTTWGYDGKGLIFADNNNLVDNNPQLATAKRGDTLKYAMEIETQRYNDAEMTGPVEVYAIYGLFSDGLVFDPQSIVVKVGGQVLVQDYYALEYIDDLGEEGAILGGAKSAFWLQIPWNNSGNFLYDEDAKITVAYTAKVSEDAPSEVWSRGVYFSNLSSVDFSVFQSTEHQAKALIDGNILIRRVDANGNPLTGVKYTIDGVRGNKSENGTYEYDTDGSENEFETNSDGQTVIANVPLGKYVVREVFSPDGTSPTEATIAKNMIEEQTSIETGFIDYVFDSQLPSWTAKGTIRGRDTITTDSGVTLADGGELYSIITSEPASSLKTVLPFDEPSGRYKTNDGGVYIQKTADGYELGIDGTTTMNPRPFVYDERTGKNIVHFSMEEAWPSSYTDYYYLEFLDDNTAIAHGVLSVNLVLNPENGCYEGYSSGYETDFSLCADSKGYRLMDKGGSLATYFSYDNALDKYILRDVHEMYYAIDEATDESVALTLYLPIAFDNEIDKYFFTLPMGGGFGYLANYSPETITVTEFLFQEKSSDAAPDSIPNPQTSDAIIKATFIVTIGLASIFVLRKQLTKRAN